MTDWPSEVRMDGKTWRRGKRPVMGGGSHETWYYVDPVIEWSMWANDHEQTDLDRIARDMADVSVEGGVGADTPEPMTRKSILAAAEKIVAGDRQTAYGPPEDNFSRIARLWEAYADRPFSAADVAIMLSLVKTARLRATPTHEDSWVDMAGYAACGGECAAKGARRATVNRVVYGGGQDA